MPRLIPERPTFTNSAERQVWELLRDSVCLLTTGHRDPIQEEQTGFHGHEGYWQKYWDGEDVFYGHVLGCKGLERKAVVLCVNEQSVKDAPGSGCTSRCRGRPTSWWSSATPR